MINDETYNLIDRYIRKELQGKELSEFEQKLETDEELREEMNFQKDLYISLESIHDDKIRQKISQFSDLLSPPDKRYLFMRANAWKALAIIIALLLFAFSYYLMNGNWGQNIASDKHKISTKEIIPCTGIEELKKEKDSLITQNEILKETLKSNKELNNKVIEQKDKEYKILQNKYQDVQEKLRIQSSKSNLGRKEGSSSRDKTLEEEKYKELLNKYQNILKKFEIQVFAIDKDSIQYPLGQKNYIESETIERFKIQFLPNEVSEKYYAFLYDADDIPIDKSVLVFKGKERDFLEIEIEDFETLLAGNYKIEVKTKEKKTISSFIFSIEKKKKESITN